MYICFTKTAIVDIAIVQIHVPGDAINLSRGGILPDAVVALVGALAGILQKEGYEQMKLSRYEQETIISFNAGEQTATVYTRDRAVMRRLDTLVIEFPEVYRCIGETDIDKTYKMPKSHINYRKPRRLSEEQRNVMRQRLKSNKEIKTSQIVDTS